MTTTRRAILSLVSTSVVTAAALLSIPSILSSALASCPPQCDSYSRAATVDNYAEADLDNLITRLKKSSAIGFFTKIALRSDVLDLKESIAQANTNHNDKLVHSKLRRQFDGLVLKILALLDDDPLLARDIYRARETIWHSLMTTKGG